MTVTASDLKDRHLEFDSIPDSFVQEKIDKAYLACNETTLRGQYHDAVEWLACHYIAISPMGQRSAIVVKDPASTYYYNEWKKIARPHGAAERI